MWFAMHLKKYIISFLLLVLGGYALLVLVYAIPTVEIAKNTTDAAVAFSNEGPYRQLNFGGGRKRVYDFMDSMLLSGNSTQDNFTDAIMLLNAENTNKGNVFREALLVNRLTAGDALPTETLIALHTGEKLAYQTESYARYWHGYLVFLKPLLTIFNYQQIRYLLALGQLALVVLIVGLLSAKGKGLYGVPVVLTYFFLNPAVCSLSLQYSTILLLTLLELVVILLRAEQYAEDRQLWLYHFFIVGCLTSYFDFLTYPLVTLGVPLIFLLSQYEESCQSGGKALCGCSLLWGAGYLTMWASKWGLASLITGENVLQQACNSISYRTSAAAAEVGGADMGRLEAIVRNLSANGFVLTLIVLIFAVCIVLSLFKKTFRLDGKYLPITLAGLLPFVWYVVVCNHSIVHSWMTFRTLAVFVYALATIGVMLMDRQTPVPDNKN